MSIYEIAEAFVYYEKRQGVRRMNDEICESEEKIEIRPFFLSDIMKVLSEIEKGIWDNRSTDKVKIQNQIILLKSLLIGIDKEGKDIITVEGLKYKRVQE